MKKYVSLFLVLVFTVFAIFGNGSVVQAKELVTDRNVTDKVKYLNNTYSLDIHVDQKANSDNVLKELNDLDKNLQMIKSISAKPKTMYLDLVPSPITNNSLTSNTALTNNLEAVTASTYNVGYYSYSFVRYVDAEIDTLKYTKKVTFNYQYYKSSGYNRFHSIYNVASRVSSIDDLLILSGLKGWIHDGFSATFSNGNRTATVKIYGHYQLGLNYNFIKIGVKEPFSSETWTLVITLK